jgi:hypothetical protein
VKPPTRPGPPKGHPGWGGRPSGPAMPCGWGCGANLTASTMRAHFTACPRRPGDEPLGVRAARLPSPRRRSPHLPEDWSR